MSEDGHGDDALLALEADAAHARRVAALEDPHVLDGEADAAPAGGSKQHVVAARADGNVDQHVALVELHGDLAVAVDLHEIGEAVTAHVAGARREHHVELLPGGFVLRQGQDRRDALVLVQRQQVDQRLARRLRSGRRQAPDLLLVDHAARGEEQDRRMRRADEQLGDEILVPRRHACAALAAAALRPIGRERHPLDIALVRDGYDHVLALDQILVLDVRLDLEDRRLARGRELLLDRGELVLDDGNDARPRGQDGEVVGDLSADGLQLVADLVAAKRGEPRQRQRENRARLLVGELVGAVGGDLVPGVGDELYERHHVLCRPGTRHQLVFRIRRARGRTDQAYHLVDVGDGDGQADEGVRPFARLDQQVLGAPPDHLLAEGGEGADHVLDGHGLGPPARERDHVGAERRLQRRVTIELVQHDIGDRIALQLDDDAHALAAGFVPDVGDALDLLVAHQLGDALDQRFLVELERDRRHHDRLAVAANFLDLGLGADDDGAAALVIGLPDAAATEDQCARREVRPGDQLHQLVDADLGIVELRHAAVDHLAQVVRRNVRRHADGDAAGAVDEQVRHPCRQHGRLLLGTVVVCLEVDRVLVDVVEQRARDLGEAALGVAHMRRAIAVEGAEVALAVDERRAQRPILRHAHECIVDRLVAVRMVLADDLADDAGALHVLLVPVEPEFVHGVQDAPVHGLQSVAHVGQRAADDDAHGVIEIAALHLLRDHDRTDVLRAACAARRGCLLVSGHVFCLLLTGIAWLPRRPSLDR